MLKNVAQLKEREKKMESFLRVNHDQVEYYYMKAKEKVEKLCQEVVVTASAERRTGEPLASASLWPSSELGEVLVIQAIDNC